jgi:hypothetical protein
MNEIMRDSTNDPILGLLDALYKHRRDTLDRLAIHGKEIDDLKVRTQDLEIGRRNPVMIRGKPHMAVIPFLANRSIEVPEGSSRLQGTSRKMPLFHDPDDEPSERSRDGWTYYSIVGAEFREIAEILGYKVDDRSCPKILTYESGFKARHYPVEWLERIARTWIERNRRRFDRRRWFKNVS